LGISDLGFLLALDTRISRAPRLWGKPDQEGYGNQVPVLTSADRRHVDNGTATNFSHLRDGIAGHEDHTRDVDAEVSVPSFQVNSSSITQCPSDADLRQTFGKLGFLDYLTQTMHDEAGCLVQVKRIESN
jgi:hypothetical protein